MTGVEMMNDWNMSRQNEISEAPDYLNANIAMFGVNLTWILFVIWAAFGFGYIFVAAALINSGITLLEARLKREPQRRRSPRPE